TITTGSWIATKLPWTAPSVRGKWPAKRLPRRRKRARRRNRSAARWHSLFLLCSLFRVSVSIPLEEFPLIHARRQRHVEKAHHHFIGGLVTPGHGLRRVGIVGVVFRIVIPGDGAQFRSGFQQTRLGQPITQLPVKVIVHAQQHFHA